MKARSFHKLVLGCRLSPNAGGRVCVGYYGG